MPRKPHFRGLKLGPLGNFGLVSDSNRKRSTKSKSSTKVETTRSFKDFGVPSCLQDANLTSTYAQSSLTDIAASAGDVDGRTTNDLNFLYYHFKGALDFGASSKATRIRIIVARIRATTTPFSGLGIDDTGLYGRRIPDIKHVYMDRTFVYNGTDRYKHIRLFVPLRGAHLHYSSNSDSSQNRDNIVMVAVTPEGATDAFVAGRSKVRWVEH